MFYCFCSVPCGDPEVRLSQLTPNKHFSLSSQLLAVVAKENVLVHCIWLIFSDPGTRINMQPSSVDKFEVRLYTVDGHKPLNEMNGLGKTVGTVTLLSISSSANKMKIESFRSSLSRGTSFIVQLYQYGRQGNVQDTYIRIARHVLETFKSFHDFRYRYLYQDTAIIYMLVWGPLQFASEVIT